MNGILYEQYPNRPHRGSKLKKPIGCKGGIDLGKDRKAVFFNTKDINVSEIFVQEFEIHKTGIFLKGTQGYGTTLWIQEWFIYTEKID